MTDRIFVHPGWVTSIRDGDSHFVGFAQLCWLYEVRYSEAIRVDPKDSTMPRGMRPMEGDVHLYPRYDGKYPIFEKENR